jgi:hypothetical protein
MEGLDMICAGPDKLKRGYKCVPHMNNKTIKKNA